MLVASVVKTAPDKRVAWIDDTTAKILVSLQTREEIGEIGGGRSVLSPPNILSRFHLQTESMHTFGNLGLAMR